MDTDELRQDPRVKHASSLLARASTVVLTTHIAPDPDGIGCEIALARALEDRGQSAKVAVLNDDPVPAKFAFMDPARLVKRYADRHADLVRNCDLVVLLDTAEIQRTGRLKQVLTERQGPILAIDHHPAPHLEPGVEALTFEGRSSTGEILANLMPVFGLPLTRDAAGALYCAILYDTQQFKFCRNQAQVFRTAADLVEAGADAEGIARRMFGTFTLDELKLRALAVSKMRSELSGKVLYLALERRDTEGLRVDGQMVGDLVDVLAEVEGASVVALFRPKGEKVKVSLRSPGRIEINDIARNLGGGGHPFAAGAEVDGDISEVTRKVVRMLTDRVRSCR